jgi:phosphatidylglycerophosphate synthase
VRANSIQEIDNRKPAGALLKDSIQRFMWWSLSLLAVFSLAVFFAFSRNAGRNMFIFTLPVIVLFTVFSRCRPDLFRSSGGEAADSFGLANGLTALRIFLVAPVLVLLVYGHLLTASILYLIILFTDVADGFIARRWNQETVFGLMLDPFGDIASTLAVFTWLWYSGVVPGWLYIILLVRYVEFFGGIVFLSAIKREPRLEATFAGKTAGVIQGLGIMILLVQQLFPGLMPADKVNLFLFPVVAAGFVAVIISQTSIGLMTLRKRGTWSGAKK